MLLTLAFVTAFFNNQATLVMKYFILIVLFVSSGAYANSSTCYGTTSNGRFVFGIFALLAEHERDRIRERTMAGLASARARGRKGGRPKVLTNEKQALAFDALQNRNKTVKEIAKALDVSEATVYRYQRKLKERNELEWLRDQY